MIEDFERKLAAETERADYAWRNARVIDAARMEDRKRFEKCEQLVNSLLDPEMYGFAVTAEVRDAARAALGRPAVETPNSEIQGPRSGPPGMEGSTT